MTTTLDPVRPGPGDPAPTGAPAPTAGTSHARSAAVTAPGPSPRPAPRATGRPADAVPRRPARPGGPAGPGPAGPAGAGPGRGRIPAPGRTAPRTAGRPPISALATGFARLFCEVEAGRRPRRHLEPVMSPTLSARLAPVWVRQGPAARVVAMTGAFVTSDRYTAVAVLRRGPRCGALAVELERRAGAWIVVEAARPEDGVLPLPEPGPPLVEHDSFDLVVVAL